MKCNMSTLTLMLVVCWASQSSAQPTTAKEATKSNWIGGDTAIIKRITERINRPVTQNHSWYNPNGGKPELLMQLSIENILEYDDITNKTSRMPQNLSLAKVACMELDAIAGQPGAWGPECKIKEFVIQPKGKLTTPTWMGADTRPGSGDYMYTPRGLAQDEMSFILENGAGKSVYVIVKLNIIKWAPEAKAGFPIQPA